MRTFNKKDANNLSLYNDFAYKVIPANTAMDTGLYEEKVYKNGRTKKVKAKGTLHQYIIVTFSRKMMEYQRTIRERQLERAKKLLRLKDPEKIKKGWPEGCFTIPIYAFSCTLSTQLDSLSSNYLLKKKESLKNGFTGLESQVINTLSEYNK